jgi:hypothetical protein
MSGAKLNFAHCVNWSQLEMFSYICVCVYNLVQLLSKSQHTGTRICCRPAVFFRHIRLTAPTIPQLNVRSTFLQSYIILSSFTLSKLRKSEICGTGNDISRGLFAHVMNLKWSLCMLWSHTGREELHSFLTLLWDGGKWSAPHSGHFSPRKIP